MLLVFRRMADSVVSKIFFALIVLSFGIWGVGDIFRGGREVVLAEVASRKITLTELQPAIERELAQARRMTGAQAVPAVVAEMLQQDVLTRTVRRELLLAEAQSQGLVVSDSALAESIRKNPVFQDSSGQFNKDQFVGQLRHIGLTPETFLENERQDLTIQYLIRGITPGGQLPQQTLLRMLQKQAEIKELQVVEVPASAITDVPAPTDAELVAFYQNHEAEYTSPETRELSYIVLDRTRFTDEAVVSDEAIEAEYNERKSEFTSPETLELLQVITRTREDAAKAFQALREKADFMKIARQYGIQDKETVTLTIKAEDLLDDAARNAVEKLNPGEFSEPVESPLGWHIYKLVKRNKGAAMADSEAKKKIAADLKAQRAEEMLFETIDKMEDAAAGGATLEEIAKEHGGTVKNIGPVTVDGTSPDGSKASVPELKDFLKTAFATDEGQVSSFVESGDGSVYAVYVNRINRKRERALDEVRALVTAAWTKDRKQQILREKATEAATKSAEGLSPANTLKEAGVNGSLRAVTVDPAKPESFEALPMAIMESLQSLEVGKQTPVAIAKNGNAVWAKLVKVTPSTLTADADDFKKMETMFAQLAATEQLEQFLTYLEKTHGVKMYPDRLPRLAQQEE